MSTRHKEMRDACQKFHDANPDVWNSFVFFSFQKIKQGHRRYGAAAVLERVRWETDSGSGNEIKINNNFRAFYARRFARLYPEHANFFRTRTQVSKSRPATGDTFVLWP